MPPLTIKADPSDLDEAAYHLGILPLDRQAPAVTGVPAPQPDQPSGALPSMGASGTGGALPPVPSASMGMGSPASADTMSTPPPSAGSSAGAQMQLQRDTNSYKPFSQLGVLGKIGRIAGYGASALVPHVAGLIPQTPLGHIAQINQDTENLRGAQQEERSQSAEQRAQSAETSEEQARESTAKYQEAEGAKDTAQADVARQQASLTPVTLGNGTTVYVPQKDAARLLGTNETNQTKFNIETSKETAAQMLQSGRPVSMDQLAARATQEGDQATLRQVEDFKKSIAAAGKQEPGSFIPVNDANGSVVGWANPKSRDWVPVGAIADGAVGQAAGGQGGSIPMKPTGQTESRDAQAAVVNRAADNLISDIQKNKSKLGNMEAIVHSALLNTPWADPETSELRAEIASFAALNPAMHGFRGASALAQFEKIIGGIPNNPDAMIAALRGIQKTTQAFKAPAAGETAAPSQTGGGGFAAWKASQGK